MAKQQDILESLKKVKKGQIEAPKYPTLLAAIDKSRNPVTEVLLGSVLNELERTAWGDKTKLGSRAAAAFDVATLGLGSTAKGVGLTVAGLLPARSYKEALEIVTKSEIAKRFMKQDEVERILDLAMNPKNRDTVVMITPNDFLKMAQPGYDPKKFTAIQEKVQAGEKLSPGWINIGKNSRGELKVTGHEGRHRARYYISKGLGDEPMPLVLKADDSARIRWGEEGSRPDKFLEENASDLDIIREIIKPKEFGMPESVIYPYKYE